MATIDFKKLMAKELAKAKAKAFSKQSESKSIKKKVLSDNDGNNDLKQFMNKHLNFDKPFAKCIPEIHALPNTNTAYYIPHFLSPESEKHLLSLIYSAPKSCWISLKRRALQSWGGKADKNDLNKFNVEVLPTWAQQLCKKTTDANLFLSNYNEPNHILINEYKQGEGIMPHKDGPAYYGRVVIISLLSTLCINFYERPPLHNNNMESPAKYQVILQPRSCFIFEHDLYRTHFHTIHECAYDVIDKSVANLDIVCNDREMKDLKIGDKLYRKQKRVSLTIRHVYTSAIVQAIDRALYFLLTSNIVGV